MAITPIRSEKIDDREFVIFSERVRAVALRLPSIMPLTLRLLELLERAPDETVDEAFAFFEFCRKRPELALTLASTAGFIEKHRKRFASADEADTAR